MCTYCTSFGRNATNETGTLLIWLYVNLVKLIDNNNCFDNKFRLSIQNILCISYLIFIFNKYINSYKINK